MQDRSDRDPSSDAAEDAAAGRQQPPGSLPDILEVFGSAPLVTDAEQQMGADEAEPASGAEQDGQPGAPARDEQPSVPAGPAVDGVVLRGEISRSSRRGENGAPAAPARAEAGPVPAPASGDERDLAHALAGVYEALHEGQGRLAEMMAGNTAGIGQLVASLDALTKQTSFLPPKLRVLGQRLDTLTTSLADDRCRALLLDVCGLLDLVEAALAAIPEPRNKKGSAITARRFFNALATRIGQILDGNGVQEITSQGAFDPTLHHAVETVPVHTTDEDGWVSAVYRRGYRTESAVLRYADVAVGRFTERRREARDGDDEDDEEEDGERPSGRLAPTTLTPSAHRTDDDDDDSGDLAHKPSPGKDDA